MVRGKAYGELWGSREHWSCPKGPEGCSHCQGPPALGKPSEHQAFGPDLPVESLAAWCHLAKHF